MSEAPREALDRAGEIARRVLDASLGLAEIHEQWPRELLDVDPLFEELRSDLIHVVEHTAGRPLRRGVDYDSYRASVEFALACAAQEILAFLQDGGSIARAAECYRKVAEPILTTVAEPFAGAGDEAALRARVRACLA